MTAPNPIVTIGNVRVGNALPLALIAGPCAMESRDHALEMASALVEITRKLGIGLIYKSSFDKANRSSANSARGIGLDLALPVFAEVKAKFGVPVITDVHTEEQCAVAAEVVDVLQIPAFLCRQTDLLVAAAGTGRPVNVKKGQFLAPEDARGIVGKVPPGRLILTERGASFGYQNLVSDMRSLVVLGETGCPVVFDATHSVQLPGGAGDASGGQREFIPALARAAVAVGVDAVFMEVHEDPPRALSDAATSYPLDQLPALLRTLQAIDRAARAGRDA